MNFLISLLCCLTMSENLTTVTKPYLNTYTCRYMVMGKENLLDEFEKVTIELKRDEYRLHFQTEEGKRERTGTYIYDETSGRLVLEGVMGYLVGNELTFGKQIGDKYFFAKFVADP